VVCFTATYNGQAFNAEQVAIAGQLEQDQFGVKRVVVGSNREALGEYIKVIHG
jgi:predicted nucleotidyltransferase